jgi:hypothetical protein
MSRSAAYSINVIGETAIFAKRDETFSVPWF